MGEKGQVTIFVIIALVIVVLGVVFYLFRPDITTTATTWEQNPQKYIYDCIKEDVEINVQLISKQGGNYIPQFPYMYQDDQIDYLCYTPDYAPALCQVQKPVLVSHVEKQIRESIQQKFDSCFSSMVTDYEERGYSVTAKKEPLSILLVPDQIRLLTNSSLIVEKKETNTYRDFNIVFENNLYGLVSIAYNILNWEATYGDADVNIYMDLSNEFLIDKIKRTDGTKIYVIKETSTGNVFQFASRSLVRAPGYGVAVL